MAVGSFFAQKEGKEREKPAEMVKTQVVRSFICGFSSLDHFPPVLQDKQLGSDHMPVAVAWARVLAFGGWNKEIGSFKGASSIRSQKGVSVEETPKISVLHVSHR